MSDMIHSPKHYTQAGVMIEPIDIIRYAPTDFGNCLKYVFRAGHKVNTLEDWKKAYTYLFWAKEGYLQNPKPYQKFIKNYGLLLVKFERFKLFVDCSHDFLQFSDRLEDNIVKEINRHGG